MAISGICEQRFERVREEFLRNFKERGEVGAAVCITFFPSVMRSAFTRLWTIESSPLRGDAP